MTTRRFSALALGTTLGLAAATVPAAGADVPPGPDPWLSMTPEGYHRFAVPHSEVREIVGAEPIALEVQASFGPAGTWSDLATELQGGEYVTTVGHLAPGLYHYQYTATLVDRTKVSFAEPSSPRVSDAHKHWNTFFVPGEESAWFADAAAPGAVSELAGEIPAHVWTPAGYDPERAEPYPVLYLLADAAQDAREWLTLGRAPQVLDQLLADGEIEPAVVVMARVGAPGELASLHATVQRELNVDGAARSLAGVGSGAAVALGAEGPSVAVGALSPSREASTLDADQVEASGALVRVYVGNALDPAQGATLELLEALEAAGLSHEFDGVDPSAGGTWDSWRSALRDFAARALGTFSEPGPRPGNLPLDSPWVPPSDPGIPHVDENGIVTFVTGPQWADAKDVTVWGNWAPNGAWFRIPMARDGERWRLSLGPLDGFYYYRYVVDGEDVKDPADSVNTLTGISQLFVPGETDLLLADAPEGQGGQLEVLDYESTVAPGERKAYVWTPPGYDPERSEPYPVLYLNHGGGQGWGDWVENGRAVQIMDNLTISGEAVPMVVVMGDGNVRDYPSELLDNLAPAAEERFNISRDPARRAIAGLSMGAMNSLTTWVTRPGEIRWVGAFSGFFFQTPEFDAEAVNSGTTLAVIHTGDSSDFTHDGTYGLMAMLDERGVAYEFPGETYGPHGFDTWMANLIDFVPRLFKDEAPPSAEPSPTTTVADGDDADTATGSSGPGMLPVLLGIGALAAVAVLVLLNRRRRG